MTEVTIRTNLSTWNKIINSHRNPENVLKVLDGTFVEPVLEKAGYSPFYGEVTFVEFDPFDYNTGGGVKFQAQSQRWFKTEEPEEGEESNYCEDKGRGFIYKRFVSGFYTSSESVETWKEWTKNLQGKENKYSIPQEGMD